MPPCRYYQELFPVPAQRDVAHTFNNISNNYREKGTGRGLHAPLKSVNFDEYLT